LHERDRYKEGEKHSHKNLDSSESCTSLRLLTHTR
jgi:hypothetical protein